MKGYKGFNYLSYGRKKGHLFCRPLTHLKRFFYEIGKRYTCKNVQLCYKGFHFCKNLKDVLQYYNLGTYTFYGEVEAKNVESQTAPMAKSVTNDLTFKRIIPYIEVMEILKAKETSSFKNIFYPKDENPTMFGVDLILFNTPQYLLKSRKNNYFFSGKIFTYTVKNED